MKEDEIVAVINVEFRGENYLVPIDNWNKAVEEGRTKVVIVDNELHFFSEEDYKIIENAEWMEKQKGFQI